MSRNTSGHSDPKRGPCPRVRCADVASNLRFTHASGSPVFSACATESAICSWRSPVRPCPRTRGAGRVGRRHQTPARCHQVGDHAIWASHAGGCMRASITSAGAAGRHHAAMPAVGRWAVGDGRQSQRSGIDAAGGYALPVPGCAGTQHVRASQPGTLFSAKPALDVGLTSASRTTTGSRGREPLRHTSPGSSGRGRR